LEKVSSVDYSVAEFVSLGTTDATRFIASIDAVDLILVGYAGGSMRILDTKGIVSTTEIGLSASYNDFYLNSAI
jgi:hypothetical protein